MKRRTTKSGEMYRWNRHRATRHGIRAVGSFRPFGLCDGPDNTFLETTRSAVWAENVGSPFRMWRGRFPDIKLGGGYAHAQSVLPPHSLHPSPFHPLAFPQNITGSSSRTSVAVLVRSPEVGVSGFANLHGLKCVVPFWGKS